MIQKAILALGLLIVSQLAMAQEAAFQEGVHYFKIGQVPADTGSDTVEVTELFSYGCSHCFTFEAYVESWRKKQAEDVKFNRIAVGFGRRAWEMMARAYITAEMLGIVEESHIAMMNAIWKEKKQFRSLDDLAEFYSQFGIEKSKFTANFQSFAADSQLRRDQRDVQLFGITGTPSLVVNRKYRVVSSKDVKDFDAMLDVVDFLVAKELAAL
ncbi:MAG: thiol:disulfide interchange protein DsbA/DsbL [Xanthomonadales bacterium]|nr:thiol:disulfide interchange protein DsbA/DsbL [Gammaproteobacteria bacterium]MBT8074018.1 thiol:disulfide interchange protein DsbA/DsbL [Gammaproteobacteria bacterium]NNK04868.1 thiol:disulfide interchange protein DsbA/DsbL [Xanthomonadales bacterium]NNK97422.1 thiol:disulfide interchange protein DsbA/DsbL [Xanthomonadales bacterium]